MKNKKYKIPEIKHSVLLPLPVYYNGKEIFPTLSIIDDPDTQDNPGRLDALDFLKKPKECSDFTVTYKENDLTINKKRIKMAHWIESKDYYKEIIRDYLEQHHPHFFQELKKTGELEETLDWRAERFLRMMSHSSNPQDDKEIFYKEMLTF